MHARNSLFFLYTITQCIAANVARQAADPEAVALCRDLTSSTTNDGTTTTLTQFPDPSCWDTLNMTDWLTNWNATTVVCTAAQQQQLQQNARSATPCQCRFEEPWATCFMRLTYAGNKTAHYDGCADLTKKSKNCTMPLPENIVAGPAEIFYGAYSVSNRPNAKIWNSINTD